MPPPPRHMGLWYIECKMEFTKTKVPPVKSKSLPTLELVADIIAFKVLYFVVRGYSDAVITDSFIFVDIHVVLSWLIMDNIKINNIFAGSRVRNINEIEKNFDIRIKYKYVHSNDNPTDLISRGITILHSHIYGYVWNVHRMFITYIHRT